MVFGIKLFESPYTKEGKVTKKAYLGAKAYLKKYPKGELLSGGGYYDATFLKKAYEKQNRAKMKRMV